MHVTAILDRLNSLGVSVTMSGDRLLLEPGSRLPPELVEEIKAYKQEILLHLKGYRIKHPDVQTTRQELEEIAERVHSEGHALLWSNVLQDLVAFYRDEEARSKIPPHFVPYSEDELRQLFGESKPPLSEQALRLIHESKKQGGRVISNERTKNSLGENKQ